MPEGAYNAGTIFLQVVPVFADTMTKIRREANDINKAVGKDLEKTLADSAERGAAEAGKRMEKELGDSGKRAGEKAGEDYAGHFVRRLQTAVSSAEKEISRLDFKTASEKSLANLDRVKAKLAELKNIKIDGEFNSKKVLAEVAAVEAALAELSKDREVDVKVNTNTGRKNLQAFIQWVEKEIHDADARITPKIDRQQVERELGAFEKRFREAARSASKSLGDSFDPAVARIKSELAALGDSELRIDINPKDAYAKITELEAELKAASKGADIDVVVNIAESLAKLEALKAEMSRIAGENLRVKVDVDGAAKAFAELSLLQRLMRSFTSEGRQLTSAQRESANSFRAFNLLILAAVSLLPGLIPLLGAAAGGLLAIGPAALGAASGIGVAILAFSGISNAVKQLANVQKLAKKDNATYERGIQTAARGVADAHRALTRARQDAANRQADAAREVVRAEQDAAQGVKDALRQQADAERALAQAQRDAKQAQDDLRKARQQAQQDLEKNADRQRQNLLDIRQAQVDLFNAQVAYNSAIADPGATNLEKEQASINLGNAKERLHSLRDEKKQLADTAKKGVDGSSAVTQAQDALTAALQRQRDAQIQVGLAARRVNRARVDGAQRVKDALRNQIRAEQDSRRAISDAQRNLTRAQQDYQDALKKTGTMGSSAMVNLHDAMAQLSPEGRRFARYIWSLHDAFYKLRGLAQAGVLPGVQAAMQGLIKEYGPGFRGFVRRMSNTVGDMFREFGKMLRNPLWHDFFGMLSRLGPRFTRQFARASMNWLSIFAKLLTDVAPFARHFANALVRMSDTALKWMRSAKGTKAWRDFMGYARQVAPDVLDFFKGLWNAGKNLVKALAPLGAGVLKGVTKFFDLIGSMDPKLLGIIATGVLFIMIAFQAMTGAIAAAATGAQLFATTAEGAFVHPGALILGAIILIIGALILLYQHSETFRKIVKAVAHAIETAAKWMWTHAFKPYFTLMGHIFKWFMDGVKKAWNTIGKPIFDVIAKVVTWLWRHVFKPYLTYIYDYYKTIFKAMKWAWDHILWPVIDLIGTVIWKLWKLEFKIVLGLIKEGWHLLATGMRWVWNNILKPVFDVFMDVIGNRLVKAFQDAVRNIGKIWGTIKSIVATPVRFVIDTVLNHGIIAAFNKVAKFVGSDPMPLINMPNWASGNKDYPTASANYTHKQPPVPKAARGAIMPGYTPGRDVMYAHVSGGEAIMRPEWTRAIGAETIHRWNRLARLGGVDALRKELYGGGYRGAYARGGVVWPLPGSHFKASGTGMPGWSTYAGHDGIDLNTPGEDYGKPYLAFRGGKIVYVGWDRGYGDAVFEQVDGGPTVVYGHSSKVFVRAGQRVAAGQILGDVGSTGHSSGPHLHFGIPGGTPGQALALLGGALDVGGQGVLSKIGGALAGAAKWVGNAVASPFKWLWGEVKDGISGLADKFGHNPFIQMLTSTAEKIGHGVADKIKDLLGGSGANADGSVPGAGSLSRFVPDVKKALTMLHQPMSLVSAVMHRMNQEDSSGDPRIVNRWDSNWDQGHPSVGLMQVIRGTFERYAGPFRNTGPFLYGVSVNPLANIFAGLNYALHAYPSLEYAMMKPGGYSEGGIVGEDGAPVADNGTMMYDNGGYLPPGLTTVLNLTGRPEPVFTSGQWDAIRSGGGAGGGGLHYEPHFEGSDLTAEDVADDLLFAFRRLDTGGKYARK